MPNKMLIDAAHPEETRVVVVRGKIIEEFDFEAANRQQLRGNIYLAKVTRVEPSLQAAFVEFGGDRHGFLGFNEIHPDYYQIPLADRKALIESISEEPSVEKNLASDSTNTNKTVASTEEPNDFSSPNYDPIGEYFESPNSELKESKPEQSVQDIGNGDNSAEVPDITDSFENAVQSFGIDDFIDEVPRPNLRKQYKIQEVIKKNQIILVQVVKEQRGNKGASLTTYLSLAGRYSVLMPNTGRGGGISRKITSQSDRNHLRQIVAELEVPEGMGVILRTAGAARTRTEIKRDFEYLIRLWENIRDLTLQSVAPILVYEEGNLVKRSIRDLYNKEISEILVAGEQGYKEAKEFMQMLMPSHAKFVKQYRATTPIFTKHNIEPQLDAMFSPNVDLKSGGQIVINQTEALVSIDVNSGKSTKLANIETTALQTNLEAANEVARQLRLRDLAGLIVIDFIDMEEIKNNRQVERHLNECLKTDRARIQTGRISLFGLLEMSRQRMRSGVLESSTATCPHCHGTGSIRSDESVALLVIRSIEDYLKTHKTHHICIRTKSPVALYILNQKRQNLAEIEKRFGLKVFIEIDDTLQMQHFTIEKSTQINQPASIDTDSTNPVSVNLIPDTTVVADEEDGANKKKKKRRKKKPTQSSSESKPTKSKVKSMDSEVNQLLANSTIIKPGNEENLEPANIQKLPQQSVKLASGINPELVTNVDTTNLTIQNSGQVVTENTVKEEEIPNSEAA